MLAHPIRSLAGKTLGIVGYGELGKGVARLGKAFGMELLVSARPFADDVPEDRRPFETVVEQSDVISLHCPLTDRTRNLFGAAQLPDAGRGQHRTDGLSFKGPNGVCVDEDLYFPAAGNPGLNAVVLDGLIHPVTHFLFNN
jgi:glycerate dehydrogenase